MGEAGIKLTLMRLLDCLKWPFSLFASALRFGVGGAGAPVEPEQPLILYEFEGCPFCRTAREAVSEVGVTTIMRPCPNGGRRFRPLVKDQGGKAQFPYLIDPNTDVAMYESADIAVYLYKTYGANLNRPVLHWLGPINLFLSQVATLVTFMAGGFARRSQRPEAPLEFYGSERNVGARLARQMLCEMELEYVWRPQYAGTPRLLDPNAGAEFKGAMAIRHHLEKTYRR